ncbi:antitoxin [Georgenia subflava]|uniref:Antitoxin n=1 Tax=Georgenia subflava TaxID=1622177 RepID=A0A6N7EMC0_9MICO|nr:antitoxin [Georgenia subflava]MPV36394.1 antitoxin [Georgenia subflava]
MGIGDLGDKAKDFANSDKGEQMSDDALEKGSDFASDKTGGKYDEHLDKGTGAADKKIGDE